MDMETGATYELVEISCDDEHCDWEHYPHTGHKCDSHDCDSEAVIAVCVSPGNAMYFVCDKHKPTFSQ